MIKFFSIISLTLILIGCGGENEKRNLTEEYADDVYALNEYSIASLSEDGLAQPALPEKLNSWLISRKVETQQIALKLHRKDIRVIFNDPSVWALFIRTEIDPVGVFLYTDIDFHLYYKYSENDDICCVNTQPFGSFDQAERSFIPIDGYIDFVNSYSGTFTFEMQEEIIVGSGVTEGPTFIFEGCWNIANTESGESGCEI